MNNSEMFGGPVSAAIVEQLGWVLLHSLWQFAAVALIAEIARQAMRRRSATTRYAMFIVALAAMTAAPVATWMCLPGIISAPLGSCWAAARRAVVVGAVGSWGWCFATLEITAPSSAPSRSSMAR